VPRRSDQATARGCATNLSLPEGCRKRAAAASHRGRCAATEPRRHASLWRAAFPLVRFWLAATGNVLAGRHQCGLAKKSCHRSSRRRRCHQRVFRNALGKALSIAKPQFGMWPPASRVSRELSLCRARSATCWTCGRALARAPPAGRGRALARNAPADNCGRALLAAPLLTRRGPCSQRHLLTCGEPCSAAPLLDLRASPCSQATCDLRRALARSATRRRGSGTTAPNAENYAANETCRIQADSRGAAPAGARRQIAEYRAMSPRRVSFTNAPPMAELGLQHSGWERTYDPSSSTASPTWRTCRPECGLVLVSSAPGISAPPTPRCC